ncbi:MAG: hypothetical protein EDM05_66920 [Leptolyngbya sp. IPPAS B-1204]
MNEKQNRERNRDQNRYKKIKQAEAEFERLIQRSRWETLNPARIERKRASKPAQAKVSTNQNSESIWPLAFGIGLVILFICLILYVLWRLNPPIRTVLVVLLCLVLPGLCKVYSIIVGGFTIFSGIRLGFSAGQSFSVLPIAPFYIFDPSLSYFCLSWGLLVASRQTRSKLGFSLGLLNLLGGVFGLFYFKSSTKVTAPGILGGIISGLYMVGLGSSIIKTIHESWTQSD